MFKICSNKKICKNDRTIEDWKTQNDEYIENISKFLDIVDNIEDERLKKKIIYQHFACENIIQKIFQKNK